MTLGACLLAAGRGRRWGRPGENKLLAPFCGRPMIEWAMDALEALGAERALVVTGDAKIAALAEKRGMQIVENREPERGLSRSIALGAEAMEGMDAALFLAGDQPRVTGASLLALRSAFEASGRPLACLCDDTHWGNPAIFDKRFFGELKSLTGDKGAKGILLRHEGELLRLRCGEGELMDFDTAEEAARNEA